MNHIETLEDIKKLIRDKIQESQNLEYKSELGDKKKNQEIAKDISAFANTSDGGIIIYGVKEKNGLPTSINWIESKDIKERIENIILSSIQPRIKDVKINPISKPDDPTKAIFIVHIPESIEAPHMVNYCYYKRHEFQSAPMVDYEVKDTMFKKGLRKALNFEISQNLELADKTIKFIDEKISCNLHILIKEKTIVFMPFYTDVWKLIVGSGLLFGLREKSIRLVEAYSLIHEINCLINCQNQKSDFQNVITPIYDRYDYISDECEFFELMDSIPFLLRDKLPKLHNLLEEIKKEFIEH